eukprot:CAMPEP_0197526948 /NCGR_PEP_ID=MMETSP1318-20131121/19846_1 /TAXON_ID=552666 /ORGANISM="Partenskyella glossopodia, Strain RCC365" /LENGTH=410 /DNA_ID=CAMNT_0043081353 /DNA_START=72 /DNA_END=1304 /DNA_ORIENTATION=+
MSIALRRRLEREYGQGNKRVKRKRERLDEKMAEGEEQEQQQQQRPKKKQVTVQEGAPNTRSSRKGIGMIRSILSTNQRQGQGGKAKNRRSGSAPREVAGGKNKAEKGGAGAEVQRARSKSPMKKKKTEKKAPQALDTFKPLLGGVNGGSVVMRKRLETEYGFKAAHKRKMGYFSYLADKEGNADKAMAVMEDTLEEEPEEVQVANAKKTAENIVKELTRSKPDSNFLSRLLQSTAKHNKRVIEQLENMERKQTEEDDDDAEDKNSIRIAGISELVKMYLKGAVEGGPEDTDSSANGADGKPKSKSKKAGAPVSRVASALFGLRQGSVLQRRLQKQYGLGGGSSTAEKKAAALAVKKKRRGANSRVPEATDTASSSTTRKKRAVVPRNNRLFSALAGGILGGNKSRKNEKK